MRHICWNYYNALSEEAVDAIRDACLEEELVEGVVSDTSSDEFVEKPDIRRSKISLLNKRQHVGIYNLMFEYALNCNQHAYGFDIRSIEDCQFGVYDSKDEGFYDWHVDTLWGNSKMSDRKISMVMQLSSRDEYEGGEFELKNVNFSEEDKARLKNKGAILTFPSFLEHRVRPVTKGKRLSLIAWVEGNKFR